LGVANPAQEINTMTKPVSLALNVRTAKTNLLFDHKMVVVVAVKLWL